MNKLTRPFLVLAVLLLALLACKLEPSTQGAVAFPKVASAPVPARESVNTEEYLPTQTVRVTAESVNIRTVDGKPTGEYAHKGQVLTLGFQGSGYAEILYPLKWQGLKIWRGCTSSPDVYGCQAAK